MANKQLGELTQLGILWLGDQARDREREAGRCADQLAKLKKPDAPLGRAINRMYHAHLKAAAAYAEAEDAARAEETARG